MRNKYWWFNEESEQVLNRGYLLKGETVQDAVDRICSAAAKNLSVDSTGHFEIEAFDIYYARFKRMIEQGWISLSSPVWANMGTKRGLPISCFNVHIPDNIEGIASKLGEVIMQTKIGGGTSGYFGDLRGRGAAISDNGESSGAVSFMQLFDTTMNVVSQGACYEEGTKVLTDSGFKEFKDVDPDKDLIAEVNDINEVNFTSEYELVTKDFEGKLIRFKDEDNNISIGVTPDHRMVVENKRPDNPLYWKSKLEIVLAKDFEPAEDNKVYTSSRIKAEGGRLTDEEKIALYYLKLGKRDKRKTIIEFEETTPYHIIELKIFLEKIEYEFKEDLDTENNTMSISFKGDIKAMKQKDLSWIDISKVDSSWCDRFFDYLIDIDFKIDPSDTVSLEKIKALCAISGRGIKTEENGDINIIYLSQIFGSKITKTEEDYDGKVYCAVVPKGKLIVSKDDKTLVCGNTRRGAFATYLDIDHPDIEEFLQIKDIGNPIQNLFTGVCVPDYWMQNMIDGDQDKRDLWAKILESRQNKGLPYIFFTDNINKNKPQIYKDLGYKINSSNLCCEIALPSNENESFVCCLASLNLELFDEWKDTHTVADVIFFLDAVMTEFINKTEGNKYLQSAHNFAKKHRALGLGVMGWHSYLQKSRIPFESVMASALNKSIFSEIKQRTIAATQELAEIYGPAPIYEGTGIMRRNTTTTAIAPTTSSSAILGQVSPGIEPYSSNYYKAGLAKGNFIRKNKYLKAVLIDKGLDSEDIWRRIMIDKGSVANIPELDEETKEVFKTFREISQDTIIRQAADRQRYIDQAQSLNINIPPEVSIKEVNKLIINAWRLGVKTLYYQRSASVAKDLLTNIVSCASCEA